MKHLIVALAFLFACIAFAPVQASTPIGMLRVTSGPQSTAVPVTPAPTHVAEPSHDDPYPAPYPAPHRKHKPAPVEPGLHCGHC